MLEVWCTDVETRLGALEAALTSDQRKRATLEANLTRLVDIARREGML